MQPFRFLFFLMLTCLFVNCQTTEPVTDPVQKSLDYQSWEDTPKVKGDLTYLSLGSFAKVLCSGVFVSNRAMDEVVLNSQMDVGAPKETRKVEYVIDETAKRATVFIEGVVSRSATYYGDQGCVIDGKAPINFTPVAVKSALPDATTLDFPMGDNIPADNELYNHPKFDEAVAAAFKDSALTAAFLVIKDGQIIIEKYGQGADKNTQLESWSMGKSLMSTLTGRLIQEGHLTLDQKAPIEAWQQEGDPRGDITIRHLLNMSGGLRFAGPRDPDLKTYIPLLPHTYPYGEAIDAVEFSVNRPLEFVPGSTGRYRNCDPLILASIMGDIAKKEGKNPLLYPQELLFDKIGIRKQILETDINGNFIITGFDYGTARNWGRIAQLYLNDGMWNGERLLPEGYTQFVSTPAPGWKPPVYGGLFWLNNTGGFKVAKDAFFMNGGGGQRVIISPSENLAIVRLGHSRGVKYCNAAINEALELLMPLL